MNCPKCNFKISEDTLFCGECGTKIERTPVCQKCGTVLHGGVLFCPNCLSPASSKESNADEGALTYKDFEEKTEDNFKEHVAEDTVFDSKDGDTASVSPKDETEEKLEKTMTIPVIRPGEYTSPKTNSWQTPSANPLAQSAQPIAQFQTAPKRPNQNPIGAVYANAPRQAPSSFVPNGQSVRQNATNYASPAVNPPSKEGQNQKNILVFLIVFLLVVLIGLISVLVVMNVKNNTTYSEDTKVQTKIEDKDNKKEDAKDNKKAKKENSSSLLPEEYVVKVDYGFPFSFTEELNAEDYEDRRYVIYTNNKYSFECDVPSHFSHSVLNDTEIRYASPDNTAYMDIGAYNNDASLTLKEVKENTIQSLNETAQYQSGGRDWFVISLTKNGVIYYQKCFVDKDYIRYFEFVYPEQYSDVYNSYVEDIEANFRRY